MTGRLVRGRGSYTNPRLLHRRAAPQGIAEGAHATQNPGVEFPSRGRRRANPYGRMPYAHPPLTTEPGGDAGWAQSDHPTDQPGRATRAGAPQRRNGPTDGAKHHPCIHDERAAA